MPKDNTWSITLEKFSSGYAPLAFTDSLTEIGASGHASSMNNVDVLDGKLTQGPALSNLTNGTQAGNVTELINYIYDRAISADLTYGIGPTKLFSISSTAVTGNRTISGCTDGQSVQYLKGNLYYFYNKTSGGDIGKFDLGSGYTDGWGSSLNAALQNAIHPVAKKEDVMVFGNGRYAGVYIEETNSLNVQKLDFGQDAVVADVIYNNGYWLIAVNSGITGTNRTEGEIFLYDGSAVPSTLSDETGVGVQRIGFLYRINGVVYVAYQDLSSSGFIIGFINGKAITPLVRYLGSLPTFAQKTLYKNTILFLSSALSYCAGAFVPELPFALSQHSDGGHGTVGAIAAPFGTPLIASTDGGSNHRLAKFSGYETDCDWKSLIFSVSLGKYKSLIDNIIVLTNRLGAGARCDLTVEGDQGSSSSASQQISTTSKSRHELKAPNIGQIEDFRIALDWANGSATNPCTIRKIKINGHFVEN